MRLYYRDAKKLGDEAVRAAIKNGVSPYLPVLDNIEEIKHSAGEVHVGLMDLPLSRIRGNKEMGRNNAFANNFMPIFDDSSEFATKWTLLYDSYLEEGIREAIKCYEYMNWYYVEEGNKRVSVSKFGGSAFILADVIRILPVKNDTKEVKVYYEYLDFLRVTKNYYIVLSEPGSYIKLAGLLGQDLIHEWPEQLCTDLKAAFFKFVRIYRNAIKGTDEFSISDSFLVYISIFPMKTLFEDTEEQIIKNIKLARDELLTAGNSDKIAFVEEAPEGEKAGGIMGFFSGAKSYSAASPLKVGFIYDADAESSRWIGSHELGRFYVDKVTGDNVVTQSYISEEKGGISDAIEKAISDKNDIIFTVTPNMMSDTLKAAVYHPEIKFLNCSVGQSHSSVRCYHGKLYEASFLMGILAADTLLLESGRGSERRIGYIARSSGNMSAADLNAFAVGVSLIDPECRIVLKYVGDSEEAERAIDWAKEGVSIFADFEYSTAVGIADTPGVYRIDNGKNVFIGVPYFNWGKYYVQIVQSVMSGAWDINEVIKLHAPANYWFGLSTGVVDIRTPELPYQTRKMLSFFKYAIMNGGLDPFSGELHSQDYTVQETRSTKNSHITASLKKMDIGKIVFMDWLNDNIDGKLPIHPEV